MSPTLTGLKVSDDRVPRIFGLKRDVATGDGEICIMSSFIICNPRVTKYCLDYQVTRDEVGGACSTHGKDEMRNKFWSENLRRGDHVEGLDVDEWVILKSVRK